jgi:protein-S-isoprenylcysteine O-methyltransferase Ste14
MVLGTAPAYGTLGACTGFFIVVLAMALKLRAEEVILTQHFSEEYLAYKKRTRILIPFVW